jgi:hypothetical protein
MNHKLRREIIDILDTGRDLTLATLRADGAPQATTVSYVNDGLAIYFGCGAHSQKAENLARDDRVSLTVDLPYANWNEIRALSLFGRARRLTALTDIDAVGRLFLARFSELNAFAAAPGEMALFAVTPLVISILDYRKGFGHSELVTAAELEAVPNED